MVGEVGGGLEQYGKKRRPPTLSPFVFIMILNKIHV
jgi:hypothetical protein